MKQRKFRRKIVKNFIIIVLIFCISITVWGKEGDGDVDSDSNRTNQVPNAVPVLRLEKPKYVLGEAIRFWDGVKSLDENTAISEEFWNTCFLHMTRPDGTVKKEKVFWPADGSLYRGWIGGHGFGKESVQVGKYILVFEFANKKTEPVELIVEKLDILDKVKAAFNFQRTGNVSEDEHIPIILTVQNDSNQVIQFPRRGVSDGYIYISVRRQEPAMRADFSYPYEKLIAPFKNKYDVNRPSSVPLIILKPTEHFEQELSFEDAFRFWGPGQYQVIFGTTFELFIGEKNGKFAEYNPIRMAVEKTENFLVVPKDPSQ